jgi:hypothetical protein
MKYERPQRVAVLSLLRFIPLRESVHCGDASVLIVSFGGCCVISNGVGAGGGEGGGSVGACVDVGSG